MRVLDLFSGIGGFSLGLERAGMSTVAFCEIDPFCRKVLAKNFPGKPCCDDITTRHFRPNEADVICGGFPCQDISAAGLRAGITGSRSGLWGHLVRAIRVVRPRFAIVENVAALLNRGMDTVLGDLAKIGHDAEWHCIPASAVGAPHRRDRIWIISNPKCAGLEGRAGERVSRSWGPSIELACDHWRSAEPDVGRVAHGVPARVDRLRSLGNAVVPQIPEIIGRAIMTAPAHTSPVEAPNG